MKLVHKVFTLCLLTASFDVFLTINLGGSLRFAQFLMLFVCMAGLARVIQDGRILWPRGGSALAIWVVWQMLCLPLSGSINIGLQFFGLLLFTIGGYFAILQLYGQSDMVETVMKAYLVSYLVIGGYGMVQFLMPLLFHVTAPLTSQWYIHGRLARINGFSYEPSFFATYIVIGWITLVDLRLSKARIASGRWMKWATIGLTIVLFASTSKTAWICMALEVVARVVPKLWRWAKESLPHLRSGKLLIYIPGGQTVLYIVLAMAALGGISVGVTAVALDPSVFLSGTGLGGTAAHSFDQRSWAAQATIDAFKDSPWIGRSLGGVPVHIANVRGIEVTTMEEARQHWGFPVLLDVLVASGILGFIPFLAFLYTNTFGSYQLANRYWPEERAKWLRALSRAMIFEWVMLMADQNLLRVYLWFHFAMVTLIAYNLEYGEVRDPAEARVPALNFGVEEASAT